MNAMYSMDRQSTGSAVLRGLHFYENGLEEEPFRGPLSNRFLQSLRSVGTTKSLLGLMSIGSDAVIPSAVEGSIRTV